MSSAAAPLELDLPRHHGWLLLAPAADILGLLLLFPLVLQSFVSSPGVEVREPSSRFVLRDFQKAVTVWVPAEGDRVLYQGELIQEARFIAALDELAKENPPRALMIRADHAAGHGRVARLTELATARGLRVGLAAVRPSALPPEEQTAEQP